MLQQTEFSVGQDGFPQFEQRLDKDFPRLAREVSAWADFNWSRQLHFPHLGCGEEAGELAHGILKAIQKIRKGANKDTALAAIKDAIGDCAIYAAHTAGKHWDGEGFEDLASSPVGFLNENKAVGFLLCDAGNVITSIEDGREDSARLHLRMYLSDLDAIAQLFDLDLLDVTNEVWAEVQKRNWRQFPNDGLTS